MKIDELVATYRRTVQLLGMTLLRPRTLVQEITEADNSVWSELIALAIAYGFALLCLAAGAGGGDNLPERLDRTFSRPVMMTIALLFGTDLLLRSTILHTIMKAFGGRGTFARSFTATAFAALAFGILGLVPRAMFNLTERNVFWLLSLAPSLLLYVPIGFMLRDLHRLGTVRVSAGMVLSVGVFGGLGVAWGALLEPPQAAVLSLYNPIGAEALEIRECLRQSVDTRGSLDPVDLFEAVPRFDFTKERLQVENVAVPDSLRRARESAASCIEKAKPVYRKSRRVADAARSVLHEFEGLQNAISSASKTCTDAEILELTHWAIAAMRSQTNFYQVFAQAYQWL